MRVERLFAGLAHAENVHFAMKIEEEETPMQCRIQSAGRKQVKRDGLM